MRRPAPRTPRLSVEPLECRVTPVIGNNALAPLVLPGTGFDGVVQVFEPGGGSGTGALLPTGRHILTAAHVVANNQGQVTGPARVVFDMPTVGRVQVEVPVPNIRIHPGYPDPNGILDDLAVLTLPALAPSGPAGFGAERYPLYRNTDEVGQVVTIVGYGTIGTGTTGQQDNADNTKRQTRNRYEVLGDRVNYGDARALLYDFDNGAAENDGFGRILGLRDTGLPDEGTGSQGDSGGPVFVQVNGQFFIAGTTTTGPDPRNPENPAVLNPNVLAGFGSISHDTRVSSYAGWIDQQTAGAAALVLDLRTQVAGLDAAADAVTVQAAGGNLQLLVNGQVYHTVPLAEVTSLTLIGAGDTPAFATTATIAATVPAGLTINYQRIQQVTDNRAGGGVLNPPAGAPAAPAPLPVPPPDARPAPALNLAAFPNLVAAGELTSVGAGSGGSPRVTVYNARTGSVDQSFLAFEPTFTGGVRVAVGDVTGDLVDDDVVSAGPGGGSRVRVFDGATRAVVRDFFAFETTFTGGTSVAVGDVDADGVGDIIVGAGLGGGPRVVVVSGATGAVIRSFFAFESGQRDGVTVAAGDVNDDGVVDIIVGAGSGGGARVTVFDGRNLAVLRNFFAYDAAFRNGVWVAAGDVDGDGAADIITGAGPGGAAHVKVFDGRTGGTRLSFFAFPGATAGVRVAAADANDDGLADVVAATGPGDAPQVRTFLGLTGLAGPDVPGFDPNFRGGVFVGGAN